MNKPFDPDEDPLQALLANAFARQQVEDFLARLPEDAGPEAELLTPFQQDDEEAAGELGSTDAFLEQLQALFQQPGPEDKALELEQLADADQIESEWPAGVIPGNEAAAEEAPPTGEVEAAPAEFAEPAPPPVQQIAEPEYVADLPVQQIAEPENVAALPAQEIAEPAEAAAIPAPQNPAREPEAQSAAGTQPAVGEQWPGRAVDVRALTAGGFLGVHRHRDSHESKVEGDQPQAAAVPRPPQSARAAGWRYAVLAIVAGAVLGLWIARPGSGKSSLRPVVQARPEVKAAQPATPSAAPVASAPQSAAGPVVISAITSSATDDGSARLTIDLQDPVKYQAYRLHHPERLYFDLQNTQLAPQLLGRSVELSGLIRKIRSAQHGPEVARVTMETDGTCAYQAAIVNNPYRLVIQLMPRPSARK